MKVSFNVIFFKVSIFILLVLSTISPKTFKMFTEIEKVYPNPHLILAIFYIPLFIFLNFAKVNKCGVNSIVFGLLVSLFYWLSTFFAIIFLHADIHSIFQSIRFTLSYLLLIPLFFFIKDKYTDIAINYYLLNALIYIPIFLYGLGVFFDVVPSINESFRSLINKDILSQSWTILGFLPKWRVVFEETQVMATFYLISAILAYKINKKLYFYLFSIFSAYLFSKSALIGLLLFMFYVFFYKKLGSKVNKTLFMYIFLVIATLIICRFYSAERQTFTDVYEAGVEHAASFGERFFHIYQTFLFMSDHIYTFFIGLGPRIYGLLVSQIFPWRFNEYSNAISFFTVFQDIGFLGFILTLIYIYYILWKPIKDKDSKIGFLAILISYLPQVSWGHSIILIGLTLLVRVSQRKRDSIY